jgi:hypothetical protein
MGILTNIIQDIRYSSRALRRSLVFTSVAVLSLALGIGANTAIFQLLNAVRLRSLPVANPQVLAEVRIAGGNGGYGSQNGINSELTNALWEQIRQSQEAFSGIFAWGNSEISIGEGGSARRARVLWASGDLFSVLGVKPARGRFLTAADDHRGCGVSYMILRRRNEIGIRLALGATRSGIAFLILREVIILLVIGLGIGTIVSLAAVRSASALLFGLSAHDIPSLITSACLLVVAAGGASFMPALRAARVDPMIILRHE